MESANKRHNRRRNSQRGSELLAGLLALLILIPFFVVIIDISWGVFIKVSLQHAVREGVRFAVTSQVSAASGGGNLGHIDSIKGVVTRYAGNILRGQEDKIKVEFFDGTTLNPDTGATRNRGRNVVMVSVEGYQYNPILSLGLIEGWWKTEVRRNPAIVITVHAADQMESCPMGTCAPL